MKFLEVPWITESDVEEKARRVLEHFKPDFFASRRYTDVETLLSKLQNSGHLNYTFCSLGYSDNGSRIQGCYLPKTRTILINQALRQEEHRNKLHFVMAHELGHFALHRKLILVEEEHEALSDDEELFKVKNPIDTIASRLDWQANKFAGALLLPMQMLVVKLADIRRDMGLSAGNIYVDDQKSTQKDFQKTLEKLSEYFRVSKTVVEIRLRQFDLITDKRGNDQTPLKSTIESIVRAIEEGGLRRSADEETLKRPMSG